MRRATHSCAVRPLPVAGSVGQALACCRTRPFGAGQRLAAATQGWLAGAMTAIARPARNASSAELSPTGSHECVLKGVAHIGRALTHRRPAIRRRESEGLEARHPQGRVVRTEGNMIHVPPPPSRARVNVHPLSHAALPMYGRASCQRTLTMQLCAMTRSAAVQARPRAACRDSPVGHVPRMDRDTCVGDSRSPTRGQVAARSG